jgi:hypothetical protein
MRGQIAEGVKERLSDELRERQELLTKLMHAYYDKK